MASTSWAEAQIGTSAAYRQRCYISYDAGSSGLSSAQNQTVTLTFQVKNTSGVKRMQHAWIYGYSLDGAAQKTGSVGTRPDDSAQAGVNKAGYLQMVAGTWYNWFTLKISVPNDGKKHTVRAWIECDAAAPRDWQNRGSNAISLSFTTPTYAVIPNKPTGCSCVIDTDKMIAKFDWDDASCSYVQVYRNYYDSDNTLLKSGYLSYNGTTRLYNKDTPISDSIPDEAVKVTYEVVNVSATGHSTKSGALSATIDAYTKVKIKVNGVWKKAIPWVKVNGVWKKCTKTYIKVGSSWKRTIS